MSDVKKNHVIYNTCVISVSPLFIIGVASQSVDHGKQMWTNNGIFHTTYAFSNIRKQLFL